MVPMKVISLLPIWISIFLYSLTFAKALNVFPKHTSSFAFPYVKPDPYPVIVQIPEGAINNFTKTGSSTGGSYALAYVTVPPGTGPAPHIHHWTNEWFYYPEGGIVMFSSDEAYPDPTKIPNGFQLPKTRMRRYLTKPGDLIYGPAYYVHGFRNEGNVTRPVILVWTPDKISQYFFEVGQIVTDPCKMPPIGDLNVQRFVSEAPRFGINMSSYWDEYVESWTDDWQPALGMAANAQELLDLLANSTSKEDSCSARSSHTAILSSSFLFVSFISLIFNNMFSVGI